MTSDEARIVVLESLVFESYNNMNFMHGCLMSDEYNYAYPDQTVRLLLSIENQIDIPELCHHSRQHEGCNGCKEGHERRCKLHEAREVLKDV